MIERNNQRQLVREDLNKPVRNAEAKPVSRGARCQSPSVFRSRRRGSIEQGSACSRDYHGHFGGKMGQDCALTRRNMINQVHALQPQPVIEFISYRLELDQRVGLHS